MGLRRVVWSYPIRVDLLEAENVRLVKPVVYCFDLDGAPGYEFDYVAEAGFICDLASTPGKLASAAASKTASAAGAVFHDHWCRVAVPKLGWDRKLGDDLALVVWRTPGPGSYMTDATARRMHAAIRLYSNLLALKERMGV
jgi:hypothetical protein